MKLKWEKQIELILVLSVLRPTVTDDRRFIRMSYTLASSLGMHVFKLSIYTKTLEHSLVYKAYIKINF
jgi:hypothetical protein